MKRLIFFTLASAALMSPGCTVKNDGPDFSKLPSTDIIDSYVAEFNAADDELYKQAIPNDKALEFLKDNIPLFECPDQELQKTYYFRWWTYRKHIKETPEGYVISEFLPPVGWAGKYNTINCATQHHMAEGRWLHNPGYLKDYAYFWFNGNGEPRKYSLAIASAIWDMYLVNRDLGMINRLYEPLKENFAAWEASNRDETGLFWQMDGLDGGEVSASGALSSDCTGYRPNLNSFMYGDASAIAKMARALGKTEDETYYTEKAAQIKSLIDEKLWDSKDLFYKVIPRHGDMSLAPCREQLGYIPFAYGIPDEDKLVAWEQMFDPQGFKAPYGPTTCERRYPGFRLSYEGHECQWNGPSWPYATSQTLSGMEKSLHRFGEKVLTKERFFEVLETYSNSHRLNGKCWIDENLNPDTGDWLSRTRLISWENGTWSEGKGGVERGKDYNHSTFADIIISGLVGLSADENGKISVNPLVPDGLWDWWCLRDARIAGRSVTVVYDKTGKHYGLGKGLQVFEQEPPYVREEAIETAKRFKEWKGKDEVVVFPILTDVHSHDRETYRHIGYIASVADLFDYDFMVNLGDIGLNFGIRHEYRKFAQELVDLTRAEMDKFEGVFLYTAGNHDWDAGEGTYNTPEYLQDTFQKPALKYAGDNLHLIPGKVYGYYDLPKKHTRVIFLNSEGTGTQEYYYLFDDEQLDWLSGILESTSDDTDIVVMCHYMPHPIGRWHNIPADYTKAANEKLMAVLAKYKAAGKQISGLYCGDSHVNTVTKTDGVNYFITQSYGWVTLDAMMEGTTHAFFDYNTEICCDVVAVKPDKNEVRSFRIGAGGKDYDQVFIY